MYLLEGGSNELRGVMSLGPNQDWDSKKWIHRVTKRSFAPHLEYANVDPKKNYYFPTPSIPYSCNKPNR